MHAQKPALGALALFCVGCSGEPPPVMIGTYQGGGQALTASSFDHDEVSVFGHRGNEFVIFINGDEVGVPLARDGSFVVEELPTGEVTVGIETEEIEGTLTVQEVLPGEVIEVAISAGPDHLRLSVLRRHAPPEFPSYTSRHSGDIKLRGNHSVYYLEPGLYHGDLQIKGNHITVVGHSGFSCDHGTVIAGDLEIDGSHISIINVAVEEDVDVKGSHVRFFGSCRR